jgi:hypothetical protein
MPITFPPIDRHHPIGFARKVLKSNKTDLISAVENGTKALWKAIQELKRERLDQNASILNGLRPVPLGWMAKKILEQFSEMCEI